MCEVSLRNVHECVRCCKNTNSVVKVTCLACKHASSTHISTTNIFFLSDGDSGIWRGGHKVSGFRKCWHCLQRARKQAVPWCGSGQFRTVQVAQPANTSEWHAHLSTVFVFISFWQYKCRTFWLYFMSSSLNAELRWKTIPLMIDCFFVHIPFVVLSEQQWAGVKGSCLISLSWTCDYTPDRSETCKREEPESLQHETWWFTVKTS